MGRLQVWSARREERHALLLDGEQLPPSPQIVAADERLRALAAALEASLERDRADYAFVPAWARGLVIARGLFDRAVLRALRWKARRERDEACIAHGATAPSEAALQARERRQRAEAAAGPSPLLLREATHFGGFVAREARRHLVPRVPALVGLAVGWWIAQTFTDSQFSATLHSWGIGAGPRHAVRGSTLRAMNLLLPVLAAALCSYAGSRAAAWLSSRYAPPPAPDPEPESR